MHHPLTGRRSSGQQVFGTISSVSGGIGRDGRGRDDSTAPRRPLRLIHVEYYLSRADAVRREKYFKTTKGKRTLRLVLKESLAEVSEGMSAVKGDPASSRPLRGSIRGPSGCLSRRLYRQAIERAPRWFVCVDHRIHAARP